MPEKPPDLALRTWPEIETYLGRSTGLFLAAGAMEQHGTHGLLGTDWICAEAVARRAAVLAGAVLAPTIQVGMAQFNLAFPGTLTLKPSTLMAVAADLIRSLAATGFRRLYFVNGHGGNIAPIKAAFQEVYAERSLAGGGAPALFCRFRSWWEPVNALRRELYGAGEGWHVTPSEVAVTMAVHPGLVDPAGFGPPLAPRPSALNEHGGDPYYDADDHRRRFPDGRIESDPRLAKAEHGRRLIEEAAAALAADYREFLAAE
jgi:creatinine amidohydrolase